MTLFLNDSPVLSGRMQVLKQYARKNIKRMSERWTIKLLGFVLWTYPKGRMT